MSFRNYTWDVPNPDWETQHFLAKELGISPITAQVLINRGVDTSEEAEIFLHGTLKDISSPWQFSGMIPAVNRIIEAINNKEKVLVYGDYDVDGMTATALLVLYFRAVGMDPGYYIPNREEGYGLNKSALDSIKKQDYSLIITVDCGIGSAEEVNYGRSLGLDFIITDHHEPGNGIPELVPIINPKLDKGEKHYSELAGVGVAFKLVQGLAEKLDLSFGQLEIYLDLVALGTIADIVPLTKENRILVKYGMERLQNTERPGIKALLEAVGFKGKDLGTYHVAFVVAPRLNAAGRMGQPLVSLELLLTNSIQLAHENSKLLQQFNNGRQLLEQTIQKEALAQLEKESAEPIKKILVLASPLWHPGVLGIVASRLTEILARPVILFTIEGEQAKGSGRSIAGFDLLESVKYCEKSLLKFGGHSQAVGITLDECKLPEFEALINQYAEMVMGSELMEAKFALDTFVMMEQLDSQLVDQLALLEPFGYGNPRPTFGIQNAFLKNCRFVGKNNNHLKCKVLWEKAELDGIGFNMGGLANDEFDFSEPVDLAFSMEKNNWNGHSKIQLVLEDFKKCSYGHLKKMSPINNQPSLIVRETFLHGSENYYCSHGSEHLRLLVDLIESRVAYNKKVLLTFPSQRILALYEGFICENLMRNGVDCSRLTNGEVFGQGSGSLSFNHAYLARETPLLSENDLVHIKYLPPEFEGSPERVENHTYQLVGFKPLTFKKYLFSHKPMSGPQRISYLKELSGSCEKPLIIYVNRKGLAVDLHYVLRKTFPESQNYIWCYHADLTFEQKEIIVQAALAGSADIIITSELFELSLYNWMGAKTKVLAEAPYNQEELFLKSRPETDGVQVFGIWTEEELGLNEKILKTIYPPKEDLALLFRYLANQHDIKNRDSRYIANVLKKGFPKLQNFTLQYVLDIIFELQNGSVPESFANFLGTRVFELAELEKEAITNLKYLLTKEDEVLANYFLAGNN
ncbi:MAG: single-stranded-DNA-specific exonuclease RecJ [Bacillota bacterium]